MSSAKKVILCILDGWGIAPPDTYNAIANAHTPFMDAIIERYSWCQLKTDGLHVGLPEGQVGTSESNHLVMGSGTVPRQNLLLIDQAIEFGKFSHNKVLLQAYEHVVQNKGALHLIGILSDGGVHSHMRHLFAILESLVDHQLERQVFIHVFTDGRDTPPQSAATYLQALENKIDDLGLNNQVTIASLQGRVFLDRDQDWDKTQQAVNLLLSGKGERVQNWQAAIDQAYDQTTDSEPNDQYLPQMTLPGFAPVSAGDTVFVYNFRADRSYQLLTALDKQKPANVFLTSMMQQSDTLSFPTLFEPDAVDSSLAQVVAQAGKKQVHITETEKHVHVTYYFNGRRESPHQQEEWRIFESNRKIKPHYNREPAMQAEKITQAVINNIQNDTADLQIINYPNTDMVGHTGDYEAAVLAAQAVDASLSKIFGILEDRLDEYALIITADHGNSEKMWDYEHNQPHTSHTHSPVPCILITNGSLALQPELAQLEDIAPTVLELMGLEVPEKMTGTSLLE